jgi:hypothetical protein
MDDPMDPFSKSLIQSGRQCHKRLWLEVHKPTAAHVDEASQARQREGRRFGEIAREVLGPGMLISADYAHFTEALAQTRSALAMPIVQVPRLFEAAFEFGGAHVRLDAIERVSQGDILTEVKSATSMKRGDKSPFSAGEYIWDCAIQTWVARGAGRRIHKIFIAHVDGDFTYTSPGNYDGLLKKVDVTRDVGILLPQVPHLIKQLKQIADGREPLIRTGPHCATPSPCPFVDYCKSGEPPLPEYPIQELPRAGKLVEQLSRRGYRDIRQVPEKLLSSAIHKRIAKATRDLKAYVSPDMPHLLKAIPYPRYYLDFETIAFAVPRWLGTQPYQQVPFQFSCHVESATGAIRHESFIDVSGDSPMGAFTDRLLGVVGDGGPILIWNRAFEGARIMELAKLFPTKEASLRCLVERLVDLLPIYQEHYYHPAMHGSWSIKAVLPTVAELSYAGLSIAGGSQAQLAYLEAIAEETSPNRRAELRSQLLAYCEMDTLAMLRLTTSIATRSMSDKFG